MNMPESDAEIRMTVGIIGFNGEPFVKYNLSAIYPLAQHPC